MKKLDLDFDLLDRLIQMPGVPGREEKVASLIESELPQKNCSVTRDNLGNLVAHFPGKGKRLMLVAHMDEVGFIVQRILPNGSLKIERMGGAGARSLPGSRLSLWTTKNLIPAQVGTLPQHLDNLEPLDLSKIYVDIGTSSPEETAEIGVRPANVLTWDSPLCALGRSLISGKALDDRLGCYILLQLAKNVSPEELSCDLFLGFVVQEETMLMGAVPVIHTYSPDFMVGIDGTLSFDTPDLEGCQSDLKLGNGPAIKWMDAIRGKLAAFVPNLTFSEYIIDTAKKNQIPLQHEIIVGMSTAISPAVFSGKGVVSTALSIPLRYHHSPIETANIQDVNHLLQLLILLVTNTPPEI